MNPFEFNTLVRAERELWWFRGMQRILFRLLDSMKIAAGAKRVLEAGCGTGYFAGLAERRYGWQVFPADLSWEGLSCGRRAGARRLVQADIASLPYPPARFDLLLCLDVLVHFEQGGEARALAEFARVLAPGGKLVLRVSALDMLRSRHSAFAGERQRFTRRRLSGAAERHGFRILRCTYANSLLLPVALARFRVWEPLMRSAPASGTAPVPGWLDRLLYLPLALESAWIGAGLNFPAGQSLILIGEKK
ncbi:MAG: methyltransferase domain-containing protein [Acidobacteriia bacterium]|nr:methyltransferase domain-containing protein [Terriglobia bacterium]